MAARNRLNHNEACRQKIQTSQLLNRLSDHVFKGKEMSPTQLRAAEIMLRKALPDLASVEHKGEGLVPYAIVVPMSANAEDWETEVNQDVAKVEH
jgi:hypothetical protein